jgi:DNA polymerase-3 subunit epsilon
MIVYRLDLETTGKDPETARILEIGVVEWDTSFLSFWRLKSILVWGDDYAIDDNQAKELLQILGIPPRDIRGKAVTPKAALEALAEFLRYSPVPTLVGHNIRSYDDVLLRKECERAGVVLPRYELLDTMTDIPFRPGVRGRGLVHLGAEHGFLNPFPHRAITDALASLKLLSQYPLEDVMRYRDMPWATVRADVSYDNRELAKSRAYGWDGDKKIWVKRIKEADVGLERAEAGFPVLLLPDYRWKP